MNITVSISTATEEHGQAMLSKLMEFIAGSNPAAFDLRVTSNGSTAATKNDARLAESAKPAPVGSTPASNRPLGKLKQEVLKVYAAQPAAFLSRKQAAEVLGYKTEKIKSTVSDAVEREELEQKDVGGVAACRITARGLKRLHDDQNTRNAQPPQNRSGAA